jgi:transposase-like protein
MKCPKCESENLYIYKPADVIYKEYTCQDCGFKWTDECPRRKDCVAPWKKKNCKPEYFPSGSLKCLIVKTEKLEEE